MRHRSCTVGRIRKPSLATARDARESRPAARSRWCRTSPNSSGSSVRPLRRLIGHGWGDAVAWTLGVHRPELLERLAILNSPHPGAFLRELQRNAAKQAASAYMNFLVRPDAEVLLAADDHARVWPCGCRRR